MRTLASKNCNRLSNASQNYMYFNYPKDNLKKKGLHLSETFSKILCKRTVERSYCGYNSRKVAILKLRVRRPQKWY